MGADRDLTSVTAAAAHWRTVAASVAGTSHARVDQPCQDVHCVHAEGALLIVAVSDGAGSALKSALGAHAAVEAAVTYLRTRLCEAEAQPGDEITWMEHISEALAEARAAVIRLAESCEEDPRQFAATLSCAVCAGGWVTAGQIGDGIVVLQDQAGALETALAPQRGEYANETSFITEDDALARAQYLMPRRQAITGLALSTDGLLRLAVSLSDHAPHAGFFDPLFAFARSVSASVSASASASASAQDSEAANATLSEFLGSERVSARTDDDKTLVLAVLTP